MFDSILKALDYLRSSANTLLNAKGILTNRLAEIQRALEVAQRANDQASMGKLIVLRTQTQALLNEQNSLWTKLNPFSSWFSTNTLGVFPVFIVAGAVALASAIYIFLEKVKNDGKTLELLKAGIVSPSQAQALIGGSALGNVLDNASSVLMWGAIAYALFMLVPMFTKR